MQIRFWGVRGSIASPGPETALVGGNTSCVEVLCGKTRLVLDAGTGLRGLGNALMKEGGPQALTLLLSHYHWDHIQGLPFFTPIFVPGTEIAIVGGTNGLMTVREALTHQMTAPVFPVRLDEVGARIKTCEVKPNETFVVGEATIRVARGNHPGGASVYRIDHAGKSVVYATDIEHYACVDPVLRAVCEGADVLIYDAQYTPEEYRGKVGWGHSTYVAGADLARSAGVGTYVLFHHDPTRTDDGVLAIERSARALFPSSIAAREGMTWNVGEVPVLGRRAA